MADQHSEAVTLSSKAEVFEISNRHTIERSFLDHVKSTDYPEWFKGLETSDVPDIQRAIIICSFDMSNRTSSNKVYCSKCKKLAFYVKGYLIWSPEDSKVRLIGQECVKDIPGWQELVKEKKRYDEIQMAKKWLPEAIELIPRLKSYPQNCRDLAHLLSVNINQFKRSPEALRKMIATFKSGGNLHREFLAEETYVTDDGQTKQRSITKSEIIFTLRGSGFFEQKTGKKGHFKKRLETIISDIDDHFFDLSEDELVDFLQSLENNDTELLKFHKKLTQLKRDYNSLVKDIIDASGFFNEMNLECLVEYAKEYETSYTVYLEGEANDRKLEVSDQFSHLKSYLEIPNRTVIELVKPI